MRTGYIVLLISAIIGIGLGVWLNYNLPHTVSVSGLVYTKGIGTMPIAIFFNGQEVGLYGNSFVVSLPNIAEYNVTIEWIEPFGVARGYCSANPILVATFSRSLNYTFSC